MAPSFHATLLFVVTPLTLSWYGTPLDGSKTLDEPFRTNRFLVDEDESIVWTVSKPVRKAMFKGEPSGLDMLARVRAVLEELADFESSSLETTLTSFADTEAQGNLGRIAQPLRIAVSGGPVSPPIFDTLAILGRESVLARIDRCLKALEAQAPTS